MRICREENSFFLVFTLEFEEKWFSAPQNLFMPPQSRYSASEKRNNNFEALNDDFLLSINMNITL